MHSIFNLKYSVPKKSSAAFHNGSNFDYNFIMKGLAEEFENSSLIQNSEKYIIFTVFE